MLGNILNFFSYLAPPNQKDSDSKVDSSPIAPPTQTTEISASSHFPVFVTDAFEKPYGRPFEEFTLVNPGWLRHEELRQKISEAQGVQVYDPVEAFAHWDEIEETLAEWDVSGDLELLREEIGEEAYQALEDMAAANYVKAECSVQDFIEKKLAFAQQLVEQGNYSGAVRELRALIVETDPIHPEDTRSTALVYYAEGRPLLNHYLVKIRYQLAKAHYLCDLTTRRGNTGARIDGNTQVDILVRRAGPSMAAQALGLRILSQISREDISDRELSQETETYLKIRTHYAETEAYLNLNKLLGLTGTEEAEQIYIALEDYTDQYASFDTKRDAWLTKYSWQELAAGGVALGIGVFAYFRAKNPGAARYYGNAAYHSTLNGLRLLVSTREGGAALTTLGLYAGGIGLSQVIGPDSPEEKLQKEALDYLEHYLETGVDLAYLSGRYLNFILEAEWAKHSGEESELPSYLSQGEQLKEIVDNALKEVSLTGDPKQDAEIQIRAIREVTHRFWQDYHRDQESLNLFLCGQGGNCVAESLLFISALSIAGVQLPEDWELGFQVFGPNEEGYSHIQSVIYEKASNRVWNLIKDGWEEHSEKQDLNGEVAPPIYPAVYLFHAYLKKQRMLGSGIPFQDLQIAPESRDLPYQDSENDLFLFKGGAGVFREGEPHFRTQLPLLGNFGNSPYGPKSSESDHPQEFFPPALGMNILENFKSDAGRPSQKLKPMLETDPDSLIKIRNLDFSVPERSEIYFHHLEDLLTYQYTPNKKDFLVNLTKTKIEAIIETRGYQNFLKVAQDPRAFIELSDEEQKEVLAISEDELHRKEQNYYQLTELGLALKSLGEKDFDKNKLLQESAPFKTYQQAHDFLQNKLYSHPERTILWLDSLKEEDLTLFLRFMQAEEPDDAPEAGRFPSLVRVLEDPEKFTAFPQNLAIATYDQNLIEIELHDPSFEGQRITPAIGLPSHQTQEGANPEELAAYPSPGTPSPIKAEHLIQPRTMAMILLQGKSTESPVWNPKLIEEVRRLNKDGRYDDSLFMRNGAWSHWIDGFQFSLSIKDGLRSYQRMQIGSTELRLRVYDNILNCLTARGKEVDCSLDITEAKNHGYQENPLLKIPPFQNLAQILQIDSHVDPSLAGLIQDILDRHPYPQDKDFWKPLFQNLTSYEDNYNLTLGEDPSLEVTHSSFFDQNANLVPKIENR